MKKISFFLTAILIFTMLSFSANAEISTHDKADQLNAMGLFYGTGNGYELDKTFTRAEASTIVVRVTHLDRIDGTAPVEEIFKDVEKDFWGYDYIYTAYATGLVKGVSATEFDPQSPVTGSQFAAILLRALLPEEADIITPENAGGYLFTKTPIDISKAQKLMEKIPFLRGDMVEILYDVYLPIYNEHLNQIQNAALVDENTKTVFAGDIIKISLDANATTGYQWFYSIATPTIVEYFFDEYKVEEDENTPPVAGRGGKHDFYFRALNTGKASIVLNYKRPFEPGSDNMVSFEFEVLESGGTSGLPAPFNFGEWLKEDSHKAIFEYISVNVYSDTWTRDETPIGSFEVTSEEKEDITDFLNPIFFGPYKGDTENLTLDFEIGMNEPFMYFYFNDEGLIINYEDIYYGATYDIVPELYDLKEYIGELRLGYYLKDK